VNIPITAVILVVITTIVVIYISTAVLHIFPGQKSEIQPVRATLGPQPIYLINHTYYINVRFAKAEDSQPVGVCRAAVIYLDQYGDTLKQTVSFAVTPSYYVKVASTSDFTISIDRPIINQSFTATIIVRFNGNYTLNGLILYYCPYKISTVPHWSDSIQIPSTPLTP